MREILSHRLGIKDVKAVYQQIREKDKFLEFSKYLHDSNPRVASQCAWVLTHSSDSEVAWLQVYVDELIDLAITTSDSALRRLVLNLLERLDYDAESIRTDFLDFCMERMAAPTELPGCQSLCLKIADKLCSFYPELHSELLRTLNAMETDLYTPAVLCVRRKILKRK